MEKKAYVAPAIYTLGSVQDLTAQNKCGGSGDGFMPQSLDPLGTTACPASP